MKTLARDFEAVAELFQFIFVFTEPFIFHAMRLIRTYVHVKILCLCNSTIFIQRGMSKCTSISYGRDFFLEIIIAPVHTCELYMNNRRYTPGCKKIFKCWHLFDSRTMSFISQSLQSNLRLIKNCSPPLLPNKVRKLFPWKPFLNRNWPLNTMNNISLHSHSECWRKYLLTRGTKHVGGASLRLTTLSQWQVTARRVTLPHSDMFIFIISQQLGTCGE